MASPSRVELPGHVVEWQSFPLLPPGNSEPKTNKVFEQLRQAVMHPCPDGQQDIPEVQTALAGYKSHLVCAQTDEQKYQIHANIHTLLVEFASGELPHRNIQNNAQIFGMMVEHSFHHALNVVKNQGEDASMAVLRQVIDVSKQFRGVNGAAYSAEMAEWIAEVNTLILYRSQLMHLPLNEGASKLRNVYRRLGNLWSDYTTSLSYQDKPGKRLARQRDQYLNQASIIIDAVLPKAIHGDFLAQSELEMAEQFLKQADKTSIDMENKTDDPYDIAQGKVMAYHNLVFINAIRLISYALDRTQSHTESDVCLQLKLMESWMGKAIAEMTRYDNESNQNIHQRLQGFMGVEHAVRKIIVTLAKAYISKEYKKMGTDRSLVEIMMPDGETVNDPQFFENTMSALDTLEAAADFQDSGEIVRTRELLRNYTSTYMPQKELPTEPVVIGSFVGYEAWYNIYRQTRE